MREHSRGEFVGFLQYGWVRVRVCGGCGHTQMYTCGNSRHSAMTYIKRLSKRDLAFAWNSAQTDTYVRGKETRRDRATPLSITRRATKQIKRVNTRAWALTRTGRPSGYSGAFPTGGMQAATMRRYSGGEVFLCASGLPDRLGQESIALPACAGKSRDWKSVIASRSTRRATSLRQRKRGENTVSPASRRRGGAIY